MAAMKLSIMLLVLAGLASILLVSSVHADAPPMPIARYAPDLFNTLLMHNNKTTIAGCCNSASTAMDNTNLRRCNLKPAVYDPNAKCVGPECPQKLSVVGLNWCAIEPQMDFNNAIWEFKNDCKIGRGTPMPVTSDYCSSVNFHQLYEEPKNDQDPTKGNPTPSPPKPNHRQPSSGSGISGLDLDVDGSQKPDNPSIGNKGDKLPPPRPGAYRYALVDYAMTQAIQCCDRANLPHPSFQDYNCTFQEISTYEETLGEQCRQLLSALTTAAGSGAAPSSAQPGTVQRRANSDGYGGAATLSTTIKSICSTVLNNAQSYSHGYCRLEFDSAAKKMQPAFEEACKSFKGKLLKPVLGSCMWDNDMSAGNTI